MRTAGIDSASTEQRSEIPANLGQSTTLRRLRRYSISHKVAVTALVALSLCAICASYGIINTYTNESSCYFVLTCAPDKQFHEVKEGEELNVATTLYVKNNAMGVEREGSKAINPNTYHPVSYIKGWLEYKDNGRPWDDKQKQLILNKIGQMKKRDHPLLVVVYVHGWHHNADDNHKVPEDGLSQHDAIRFDYFMGRVVSQLKRLYEQRGSHVIPTVLGIYVGWRGDTITTPGFRQFTFANRAKAANQLADLRGADSLYGALETIANAVKEGGHTDNKMLMVGHSFGARVISRLLIPEMEKGIRRPFGEHTYALGISPAIGANCFNKLFEGTRNSDDTSTPGLMLVTSEDDETLSWIYTVGSLILGAPNCNHYGNSHTSIGQPDHRTHTLRFRNLPSIKTKDEGLKILEQEPGAAFPRQFQDKAWHSYTGTRTLLYPEYKTGPSSLCRWQPVGRCYVELEDSVRYEMSFELGDSFNKSNHVWVIATDSNTIGYQNKKLSRWDRNHNGFISTNLTRLIIEWMYEQLPTPPLP